MVVQQSDARGPFYAAIFSRLRTELTLNTASSVILYVENLDLSWFKGPEYERSLLSHLRVKYRDGPASVIVAVGAGALEFGLRWRAVLWPGTPIVSAFVDEATTARLDLPDDVTGRTRLEDVTAAGAVVPNLERVAIVGDRFETQQVFREFKDQIAAVAAKLEIIDLTGLPMRELRERGATLADDTAILYMAIDSDSERTYFRTADALAMIAETANRPIVGLIETFVRCRATGGFVAVPGKIGQEAATLSLGLIDDERPNAFLLLQETRSGQYSTNRNCSDGMSTPPIFHLGAAI